MTDDEFDTAMYKLAHRCAVTDRSFTPISYYGGKVKLVPYIVPLIESQGFRTYVEPFTGGGAVFFGLRKRNPSVGQFVLNDLNGMLLNFYIVGRDRPKELLDLVQRRAVYSSKLHRTATDIYKGKQEATDLEKAWAVFYSTRVSFSALLGSSSFGRKTHPQSGSPIYNHLHRAIDRLPEQLKRLESVVIEEMDAVKLAKKYESEHALFYFDPPYVGANQGHYTGYTQDDFDELLDFCAHTNSRFILSHYANPAMEKLVQDCGWSIKTFDTHCTVAPCSGTTDTRRTEVVVCNFRVGVRLR